MPIIKCKMCGGDIQILENQTYGACDSCGSTMTLPRADDDRKVNLFNRANHFRRNNEFDKAAGVYESILNQSPDAEAYWGLVLCKYGIEYVEDPVSHRRVPTCHRTQYGSILSDADYLAALESADSYARAIYEQEAKNIDAIQKAILQISSREEPFDVFICYKETGESGTRTPDSVLAQDLFYQLTDAGFKVFFARITLEDKLGSAYEPYIFAALNSSKVMVAITTKPDNISSVWVKNEWSRYLALIKKGEKKVLIPAYRDMDPYDLPDDFSHLQAQDMGKLGFMQDLVRGIKKIISDSQPKAASSAASAQETMSGSGPTTASLLRRAFICLEDGEFKKADELLEQVLNIEPECAKAYIGKLMCALRLKEIDELAGYEQPLADLNLYKKAIRFSKPDERPLYEGYNQAIVDRIETQRRDGIYRQAQREKEKYTFDAAASLFRSIAGYLDSNALAEECDRLAAEKERMEKEARQRWEELKKERAAYNEMYGHIVQKRSQLINNIKNIKDDVNQQKYRIGHSESRKDKMDAIKLLKGNERLLLEYQRELDALPQIPPFPQ